MEVNIGIWAHKKRTNHKADSARTSRLGLRFAIGWRLTKVACAVLRAMHFETELASNFSEGVIFRDSVVLDEHLWDRLRRAETTQRQATFRRAGLVRGHVWLCSEFFTMEILDHKDSFVLDWLLSGAIEKNGDKGDVHEEASCVDQTGGLEINAATQFKVKLRRLHWRLRSRVATHLKQNCVDQTMGLGNNKCARS